MRLVKLSANQSSFRSVRFNETGLTLIIAKRHKQSSAQDVSKTYNGVGKSLMVYLLHFCLGANKDDQLATALPGWIFSLECVIQGNTHNISRSTEDQDQIHVDGEAMTLPVFRKWILPLTFGLPKPLSSLSFRTLITYFLRPGKHAFITYDQINKADQPFDRLLRTGFLLGLDHELIAVKNRLREKKLALERQRAGFRKDPIIKEMFADHRDIDVEIAAIGERLARMDSRLRTFRVAEDYHEIQRQANTLRSELQDVRNEVHLLEQSIDNIENSLTSQPDVDADSVIQLYNEACVALPEAVVRSLKETERFHADLLVKRLQRLTREKRALQTQLDRAIERVSTLSPQLDEKLRFLGEHGALDEFTGLSAQAAELKVQQNRLNTFRDLSDRYSQQIEEVKARMVEENVRSMKYLTEIRPLLGDNLKRFRSIARRLYPDSESGIVVQNNAGDNTIRFNIEARIESDASDGINEAKIFCYDMAVLTGGHNHSMGLLIHDSRLFSDMDPRQRGEALRVAQDQCVQVGLQYIATMNEDQVEALRDVYSAEEFASLVTDRIVLQLTDGNPREKLLGIQVALDYD